MDIKELVRKSKTAATYYRKEPSMPAKTLHYHDYDKYKAVVKKQKERQQYVIVGAIIEFIKEGGYSFTFDQNILHINKDTFKAKFTVPDDILEPLKELINPSKRV